MYHLKHEHIRIADIKFKAQSTFLYLIKHELRAFLFAEEFSMSVDVVKAEKIETKFL